MTLGKTAYATHNGERARVYEEGGMSFDVWVEGFGWCLNDDGASDTILAIACAVRAAAFPQLAPLTVADMLHA